MTFVFQRSGRTFKIVKGAKMGKNVVGLLEILDDGGILKLADGSLFKVDPFDLSVVSTWSVSSEIELSETHDNVFNFTLTNSDQDAWVRATKLKGTSNNLAP